MLTRYIWESVETVIDAKYCILAAGLVYCIAAAIGWHYAESFSWLQIPIMNFAAKFSDLEALGFIIRIFFNNAVAVYITMCLVSIFGIVPLFSAVLNGVVVGWVVARASVGLGIGDVDPLMLIPHGIFEWPAMIMGWGVGIWKGLGYRRAPIARATVQDLSGSTRPFSCWLYRCCWWQPSLRAENFSEPMGCGSPALIK